MRTSTSFFAQRRYSTMLATRSRYTPRCRDTLVSNGEDNVNVQAENITEVRCRWSLVEASFRNVPSFLYLRDQMSTSKGRSGAFHGCLWWSFFYAFVRRKTLATTPTPNFINDDTVPTPQNSVISHFRLRIIRKDLSFLYGTIFRTTLHASNLNSHVCIFAEVTLIGLRLQWSEPGGHYIREG